MPSVKALIIQGGGFRTAFSSGVLDAFIEHKHNPFDLIVAVSGGAIAASYYLAGQQKDCFRSICFLSERGRFLNISRVFRSKPLMDVDVFNAISNEHFPLDFVRAKQNLLQKKFAIVMTHRSSGKPHYCDPTSTNWQNAVIASCSLPFITKGKQELNGHHYMDGAWSDPLPVKWAVAQGATDLTVVRTSPENERASKTWFDRVGELYYLNRPELKSTFSNNHQKFNQAIDFMSEPPSGITIRQIAPKEPLKSGLYTNSVALLEEDHANGFAHGESFLKSEIVSICQF